MKITSAAERSSSKKSRSKTSTIPQTRVTGPRPSILDKFVLHLEAHGPCAEVSGRRDQDSAVAAAEVVRQFALPE